MQGTQRGMRQAELYGVPTGIRWPAFARASPCRLGPLRDAFSFHEMGQKMGATEHQNKWIGEWTT